ncbi:hypothetical protein SAMN02927930_01369 [Pseudidiomarina indica]|uniref:Uncharacterized protein n=1 Tax=Pseudidiomarina indica TaxID=1159017 RepID=A0A1G6CTM1_9GAMM|nr:hypothetical protein [Pseudidiomarina indica]SDB36227.1 hypothetical protein SAMN02927930_01369 [Pseudidiomarina indica]
MRSLFILLLCAAAIGCSSTSTPTTSSKLVVDHDRVEAIERVATVTDVEVYWINPPKKRVNTTDN